MGSLACRVAAGSLNLDFSCLLTAVRVRWRRFRKQWAIKTLKPRKYHSNRAAQTTASIVQSFLIQLAALIAICTLVRNLFSDAR